MQFKSKGITVRLFNSDRDNDDGVSDLKQYSVMAFQLPGIRIRNDSMEYLQKKFIQEFCDLNNSLPLDSPPLGLTNCKLAYLVLPLIELVGYENDANW